MMSRAGCWRVLALATLLAATAAEDPYRYFTWNISYGDISPLGVRQQGILINGMYPGPNIYSVTNDNLIINVFNNLPEAFLLSWNGLQQRKNSYQDGVYGTTCPILPGKNYTYKLQVKDQIGTFFYFPSLAFHKAAGGFGGIKILSRKLIPVPFDDPAEDITFLIGDWHTKHHTDLRAALDRGETLPLPDGLHINGNSPNSSIINFVSGKTYRLRISNVGLGTTLNFRIQGHKMKLVEVEGTHTLQTVYASLDIAVGQSVSVLVTANRPPAEYYISVSTRFATRYMNATSILRYSNSTSLHPRLLPPAVNKSVDWSISQARSIRTNLTASGPRPNPQGSYHYGLVNITKTIKLVSSAETIKGKQRYAVNGVSFVAADTPLKLADYFKIAGVYNPGNFPENRTRKAAVQDTSVITVDHRGFVEIVFENVEDVMQSWHLDGYSFFVVGMGHGRWSLSSKDQYNLRDAVSRCTVQVFPKSWSAIYVALDNVGMWNLRSETWARQYLGQQLYLRVNTTSTSLRDEYLIPHNAVLCGRAQGETIS